MKKKTLDFFELAWFRVSDFFKNWFYPAYYLRNLLFHRYDIVKIPHVKPWQYSDCVYRMQAAVMELVCEFVEEENKNPIVDWDDKSADLPDGRNSFAVAKEICQWWRVDRDFLQKQYQDFLDIYCTYCLGKLIEMSEPDENGCVRIDFVNDFHFNTLEEAEKSIPEEEWKKFDAVCDDRSLILDKNQMREIANKLEKHIEDEDQRLLHAAIDIRNWLWT